MQNSKNMSFGEILVILIVALFVVKPEDIPAMISKFQHFRSLFTDWKKEILSSLSGATILNDEDLIKEAAELNFYLEKIIDLQGHYDGEYSIEKVKSKYYNLVKEKM